MRRPATALAMIGAVIAAVALYAIAYDTRRLEARVNAMERQAERVERDIAVDRAELAHLSRPNRIEPLARAIGLRPPTRTQYVAEDRLPRRGAGQP